ncbi:MAG TPA: hypothetical protein VGO80_23110 [Solirubrobacteraceae bacterium]|jgi:hypothetical protein|nr:hypothetical protein [Solirubrobacteraceae bacterium]
MRTRHQARAATLAALTALALPAGAAAAAPWTAPVTIPGAAGAPQSVVTRAGHGLVLSGQSTGPGFAPAQLAAVTAEGTVGATLPLSFVASALATYGSDRVVVAGRTLATSGPNVGTIDDTSLVVTRFGTPARLAATRAVPGTEGQQLYALAANDDGLVALVTGGLRTRTLRIRRPGSSTFTTKLRFAVSNRARGATVAVGDKGDVLVVYEDAHEVRARHVGPRGTVGSVHRIGAGVQSDLQAVVSDDGRLEVAWKSQRVSEGEAGTPAIVSYATAAPGHGFGRARRIATVGRTGAGRFVAPPGVRLIAAGDRALLAYTGFDGSNYTVEARQVDGGRVGAAQRLSPAGVDAVLGDAAVDAKGAQVVAWRSAVAGADPVFVGGQPAHTPVLANVRGASADAFGGAEAVSPDDVDVPYPPSAAIDPVSGRAIVAYGMLSAGVQVASRPAA